MFKLPQHLLPLIISLFTLNAYSQNYDLFDPSRLYIYEYESGGSTHIALFKADTIAVNGNQIEFSNYERGNDDYTYGIPANSFIYYDKNSWAGNNCIINQNGTTYLVNENSDTLTFKPLEILNNSWLMYQFQNGDKFVASISSLAIDSVLGTMDSIKYIKIQRYDSLGNTIPDSLNNFEFMLSKNYGLVKTVSIKHFPNDTTTYRLNGIDSILGDNRITPASVFDFDVGDIFHYYSFSHTTLSSFDIQWTKREIYSKTVNPGQIIYTLGDSVYLQHSDPGNFYDTLIFYGRTEIYSTNIYDYDSLFSKLPMSFNYLSTNFLTTWHRSVNNRRGIYTVPCVSRSSPNFPTYLNRSLASCIQPYCSFPGGSNWFMEGLGLFSHSASYDSASSIYSCNKQMVYYKKGLETYGTPVAFPATTGISKDFANSYSPYLLINPVNDLATIKQAFSFDRIKVTNSVLKEIPVDWRKQDDTIFLNCSNFSNGIYFISLSNKDKFITLKLILIN